MPRATNAPASRARRKRVIKSAKGYRGRRSKLFRYAKDATMKGKYWAYRDRKILSDLALTDDTTFKSIVDQAKGALEDKSKSKKKAA